MAPENHVATTTQAAVENERPGPTYRGLYRFCSAADFALLIPAIAVSIASGILTPAFTVLLGKIFTSIAAFSKGQISGHELEEQIKPLVIGICVLGVGAWGFGWAHMSMWLAFGENVRKRAKEAVFKGLLEKNMTWFDQKVVDNGVSGYMNKAIKCRPPFS